MKKNTIGLVGLGLVGLLALGIGWQQKTTSLNSFALNSNSSLTAGESLDSQIANRQFVRNYAGGESGEQLARTALELTGFDLTEFNPKTVSEAMVSSFSRAYYGFVPYKSDVEIRTSVTADLNGYVTATLYLPRLELSDALVYIFAINQDKPTIEDLELVGFFEVAIAPGETTVEKLYFQQENFDPILEDKEITVVFYKDLLHPDNTSASLAVSDFNPERGTEVSLQKPLVLANYSPETVLYTYVEEPTTAE